MWLIVELLFKQIHNDDFKDHTVWKSVFQFSMSIDMLTLSSFSPLDPYCQWPNKFPGRLFNFRGPKGAFTIDRRHLKKIGVFSYNCNKLNKTNMLSAKILRKFRNSGKSTPSIDMSRPSGDPYCSFKSQYRLTYQNPCTLLIFCVAIVSLS